MARTSRFLAPLMVLALLLSSAALVLPSQQVLAADYWSISIPANAGTDGGNASLKFGTVSGATDAYDAGTDVAAPPAAPGATFDSYFQITSGAFTELNEDYRAALGAGAGSTIVWNLYLSSNSQDITLTWGDPAAAGVPVDATIVLSGGGQTINMRSTTTATYPDGDYSLTITVTRLGVPTEVWVDDDWCEPTATDGQVVGDGYIYGYNAFCDIQEGVDAVDEGATVHVLNGSYSAFNVTEDDISVIGEEDGAAVRTIGGYIWSPTLGGNYLAGIFADGALLQNLEFSGVVFPSVTMEVGVYCENTTGTVLEDLIIHDIRPTSGVDGYAIYVASGEATVDIVNPDIYGCLAGIYVEYDTANVTGGSIRGGGMVASYNSVGIWAGEESFVTVSGTEIYDCTDANVPDEPAATFDETTGWGIFVDQYATVTCTDCCDIHNNFGGIGISHYGSLTANGNNIHDNIYFGVAMAYVSAEEEPGDIVILMEQDCEYNWWGDERGPTPVVAPIGEEPEIPLTGVFGDSVTPGIDYTPWLDGPCPSGDPVGLNAKLKGIARSGQPGLEVSFTDMSTPAPGCDVEEWLWNFGDGSTSNAQNPSHVYTREGTYTVTLTVVDSCGFKDSITMKAYITIKKSGGEALEPARMVVSYLLIDPLQVLPGQEVLVSGNVCNQGEERGTKTVSLMVNGVAEQSQTVGVSGGSCQQVSFRLSRAVPGTYQVAIDGMTGQFSVLAPRTVTNNVPSQQDSGLGTVGIVIIIALAVAIIAALIFLFRK